jgi:hypothetical protein
MAVETRLNVCDLNAIETRVGAWVAGCTSLMDVFKPYTDPLGTFRRNGKDSYIAFATKVYPQYTYESLFLAKEGHYGKEQKAEAKIKRQFGKIGVLGSIYRMGAGGWGKGKASYIDHFEGCPWTGKKPPKCSRELCPKIYDRVRTGLWGFAYGQGVMMEQKDSALVTDVFRNTYTEICHNKTGIWAVLEDCIMEVMDPKRTATKRYIGPNDCIMIDRVNLVDRPPLLRITLPSGRRLHYLDAHINEKSLMPWKGTDPVTGAEYDVYRPALWYAHEDQVTGQWGETTSHGGKTFENIVQGIARDVLAVKLMMFEAAGLPVIGHVHDEGITLTSNDPFALGLPEMIDMMSESVNWAPGLLLGADGFEGTFYHK